MATDGSGFVTGMAFYQLQSECSMMSKENQQLKGKVAKLKDELQQAVERMAKEKYVHVHRGYLCVYWKETCMYI